MSDPQQPTVSRQRQLVLNSVGDLLEHYEMNPTDDQAIANYMLDLRIAYGRYQELLKNVAEPFAGVVFTRDRELEVDRSVDRLPLYCDRELFLASKADVSKAGHFSLTTGIVTLQRDGEEPQVIGGM